MTRYDIAVIGAGTGGYVAALRAAQRGARVALVEKERVGGTCLNHGCIPTKALMRDAEVYHDVVSGQYALRADTPIQVDFAKMMARKQQVVETLVGGVGTCWRAQGRRAAAAVAARRAAHRCRAPASRSSGGRSSWRLARWQQTARARAGCQACSTRELLEIDSLPERDHHRGRHGGHQLPACCTRWACR